MTLIRDCRGNCGSSDPSEIILILGSNGGPTSFSLGVGEPDEWAGSPAEVRETVASIAARNPTPVEPGFRGSGGWAGTLAFLDTDQRTVAWEVGVGDLSIQRMGLDDAAVTVEMSGAQQVREGLAALDVYGAWQGSGVGAWTADVSLPPLSEEGVAVEAGAAGLAPALYPAPVTPPTGTGLVATEPGTASFNLTRRTSSPGRVLLVSWGWSTAGLQDLYGREWRDAIVLPPADDRDDLGMNRTAVRVAVPGIGPMILGKAEV